MRFSRQSPHHTPRLGPPSMSRPQPAHAQYVFGSTVFCLRAGARGGARSMRPGALLSAWQRDGLGRRVRAGLRLMPARRAAAAPPAVGSGALCVRRHRPEGTLPAATPSRPPHALPAWLPAAACGFGPASRRSARPPAKVARLARGAAALVDVLAPHAPAAVAQPVARLPLHQAPQVLHSIVLPAGARRRKLAALVSGLRSRGGVVPSRRGQRGRMRRAPAACRPHAGARVKRAPCGARGRT